MDCICAISDENFLPHFATLLCSVSINSPGYPVILVSTGISDESRSKLASFATELGVSLEIIEASSVDLSQLPTFDRWPKEVWLKLYLADLVPARYTRMLHLDCDMVVIDNLSELIELDMAGSAIAAVPDETINAMTFRKKQLGIPDDGTYYNAGCLLVDLDAWRKKEIRARTVDYALQNRETIHFLDQDALNAVAWSETTPIDHRWNFAPKSRSGASEKPSIIHYIGKHKPWKMRDVTGAEIYRHFRSMTPWPHYTVPRQFPRSISEWKNATDTVKYKLLAKLDRARNKPGVRHLTNPDKSAAYYMATNRPLFDKLAEELKT